MGLSASAGHAQVDCDRYPPGSAARDSCYQTEYYRAHEDVQRAYDERERGDRFWRERSYEQQRQLDRAWHELDPQDRDSDR